MEDRDRQILDAAAALFYERSFHAVGVDLIGERAGVTGPAIYRHFSGKDEILATLLDEALDRLFAGLPAPGGDPGDELRRLAIAHARAVRERRELVGIGIRERRALAGNYRKRLARRERMYAHRWLDALSRLHPGRDEHILVAATNTALALLNSVAHWPPEFVDGDQAADLTVSLALGSLEALAIARP